MRTCAADARAGARGARARSYPIPLRPPARGAGVHRHIKFGGSGGARACERAPLKPPTAPKHAQPHVVYLPRHAAPCRRSASALSNGRGIRSSKSSSTGRRSRDEEDATSRACSIRRAYHGPPPTMDGSQDARIGQCRGVAFALQLELCVVDATGNVGGEDDLKVDPRRRATRPPKRTEQPMRWRREKVS
jgi:hypothetical protein